MKVAVTGASGLLGAQVLRAAAAAGHEVLAVTRPGSRSPTPRVAGSPVPVRTADVADERALRRALAGVEGLVHCAAVYAFGAARAEEVSRVNVAGTGRVVSAAARAGVRQVVVTSSSVTRGSSARPEARTERDVLGDEPSPAYYASKVAQEEAALAAGERHGIPVVLALPTVVLGGPYASLAPSNAIVLRYLLDPTRSTYPGGCNVVDARDVGAGCVLLLERGAAGQRYLLGGTDVTWRLLHTLVADLAGLPGPYAEVSRPAATLAAALAEGWGRVSGRPPLVTREEALTVGRHYWYCSARAQALGYAARPARDAVAASLAWLLAGVELPRWVREGLRVRPEVRAARELVPRPLADDGGGPGARPRGPQVSPRPPRSRPPSPRHPR